MKKNATLYTVLFILSTLFLSCGGSDDSNGGGNGGGNSVSSIVLTGNLINFGDVQVGQMSSSQSIVLDGIDLTSDMIIAVDDLNFEISIDDVSFTDSVTVPFATANLGNVNVYIRFSPGQSSLGANTGNLSIQSDGATTLNRSLAGTGIPTTHNYQAFQNQRIAFGGGFNQTETAFFNLHNDNSNIETIKMFIQLDCPTGGCNAWDVYATLKAKDVASGKWYELGRYITPYGVDNSALDRGFEIDVTDFKSILEGNVELYARIETWGSDGWEVSVDFDFIEGTPDYQYYAVEEVLGYSAWSTSGVPYGVTLNPANHDLDKSITIPANAEVTSLRTIISGWGHATPAPDGRGCAEWCYREHDIKIDGVNTFQHNMGPIGCSSNPVSPQGGNWSPDRAGWCPGMAVPVRKDVFGTSMAGANFVFEYDYEDWTTDGGSTTGQNGGSAYYATSTYVIVKSNTPIVKPTVN